MTKPDFLLNQFAHGHHAGRATAPQSPMCSPTFPSRLETATDSSTAAAPSQSLVAVLSFRTSLHSSPLSCAARPSKSPASFLPRDEPLRQKSRKRLKPDANAGACRYGHCPIPTSAAAPRCESLRTPGLLLCISSLCDVRFLNPPPPLSRFPHQFERAPRAFPPQIARPSPARPQATSLRSTVWH